MTPTDLTTLCQQITARWQGFAPPTGVALQDWREALADMAYPAGLWAVKDHLKHSKWPPNLADILSRAGHCPYHGPTLEEQDHHGYPGIYIECVEAPEYSPGRLGWRKPLAYNAFKPLPLRANMEAWAEEWARTTAELYGGTWTVGYDESTPPQERTSQ